MSGLTNRVEVSSCLLASEAILRDRGELDLVWSLLRTRPVTRDFYIVMKASNSEFEQESLSYHRKLHYIISWWYGQRKVIHFKNMFRLVGGIVKLYAISQRLSIYQSDNPTG